MLNQYILGLLFAFVAFIRESDSSYGVAYDIVNADPQRVSSDLDLIKSYNFEVLRLYEWHSTIDIASMARSRKLKIVLTVEMDKIKDSCDIVNAHPDVIESVCMGNEWLAKKHSVEEMITHIKEFRGCLKKGSTTKVASCERMTEYALSDLTELKNHVDFMLVSIHPFFSAQKLTSGMETLRDQFHLLQKKYGNIKLGIAETGYPSRGGVEVKNAPSESVLCEMFAGFREFTNELSKEIPNFYFMLADTTYKSKESENSFGFLDKNRKAKC